MESINIIIGMTVGLVTIFTFLGAVFSHFVLAPLEAAIKSLQETCKDIRTEIKEAGSRRHELELKVIEIDQRAKSAHHRLDDHINKEKE